MDQRRLRRKRARPYQEIRIGQPSLADAWRLYSRPRPCFPLVRPCSSESPQTYEHKLIFCKMTPSRAGRRTLRSFQAAAGSLIPEGVERRFAEFLAETKRGYCRTPAKF